MNILMKRLFTLQYNKFKRNIFSRGFFNGQ